jgi:O-antigen/teichoic acid export membrane protein
MNIVIEILLLILLIKTMNLNPAVIWIVYVISKLLSQVYIMWEEGLRQSFLKHFKIKE